MTDYSELKQLAEASRVANHDERGPDEAFQEALHPEVVLALIAENERLDGECEGCPMAIAEELRKERDQLKAENDAMRTALEKISAYAPCSGIKDPGFTKMHMGILARDAIAAAMSQGEQS